MIQFKEQYRTSLKMLPMSAHKKNSDIQSNIGIQNENKIRSVNAQLQKLSVLFEDQQKFNHQIMLSLMSDVKYNSKNEKSDPWEILNDQDGYNESENNTNLVHTNQNSSSLQKFSFEKQATTKSIALKNSQFQQLQQLQQDNQWQNLIPNWDHITIKGQDQQNQQIQQRSDQDGDKTIPIQSKYKKWDNSGIKNNLRNQLSQEIGEMEIQSGDISSVIITQQSRAKACLGSYKKKTNKNGSNISHEKLYYKKKDQMLEKQKIITQGNYAQIDKQKLCKIKEKTVAVENKYSSRKKTQRDVNGAIKNTEKPKCQKNSKVKAEKSQRQGTWTVSKTSKAYQTIENKNNLGYIASINNKLQKNVESQTIPLPNKSMCKNKLMKSADKLCNKSNKLNRITTGTRITINKQPSSANILQNKQNLRENNNSRLQIENKKESKQIKKKLGDNKKIGNSLSSKNQSLFKKYEHPRAQKYQKQNPIPYHMGKLDFNPSKSIMQRILEVKSLEQSYENQTNKYMSVVQNFSTNDVKNLQQQLTDLSCVNKLTPALEFKKKIIVFLILFFEQFQSSKSSSKSPLSSEYLVNYSKMINFQKKQKVIWRQISEDMEIIQYIQKKSKSLLQQILSASKSLPSKLYKTNILSQQITKKFMKLFNMLNQQLDQQLEYFLIKKTKIYHLLYSLVHYTQYLLTNQLVQQTERLNVQGSRTNLHNGYNSSRSKRENNYLKKSKTNKLLGRINNKCDSQRKITMEDRCQDTDRPRNTPSYNKQMIYSYQNNKISKFK